MDGMNVERRCARRAVGLCHGILSQIKSGRHVPRSDIDNALCVLQMYEEMWGYLDDDRESGVADWSIPFEFNQSRSHPLGQRTIEGQPQAETGQTADPNRKQSPHLPPEVLASIFAHLDATPTIAHNEESGQQNKRTQRDLLACCFVNKAWKAMAAPFLWKNPRLWSPRGLFKLVYCSRISRFSFNGNLGTEVRRLDTMGLQLEEPLHTPLIRIMASTFPNLEMLRLGIRNFHPNTIEHVFDLCHDIQCFALRGDPCISFDVWGESSVPHFMAGMKKLSALCLHNVVCDAQSMRFYHCVLSSMTSTLRHLNIGRTWVGDEIVTAFAKCCPHLQTFILEENSALTDVGIEVLAMSCRDLRFVKLRNCIHVGDDGITALVKRCRNLTVLGISYTRCTDATIQIIAERCQHLHTLFMEDILLESEDTIIKMLEMRGKKLTTLAMASTDVISQATVDALISYCPELRELDLASCGSDNLANPITEASIDRLVDSCPKLRTLLVCGVDGISDEYLDKLSSRLSTTQFWLSPPDELTGWIE
ncbi:uncharacterized protein EV422DRAFT_311104 [Fimicolochytrium jonesii]|uniref:uncharacterized protein n=1 Tax=Fimicolochytrium jonesii TaxID=1396493 RepID=UPI0022FF2FC7|nr:uncharacterized protein EV422DRAFT_311104 [Fimicolochytrium jonesii]KAI8824196.1 hypothetical protein EV422DRAFT_311104 [Fimicolochytrium jonesii]